MNTNSDLLEQVFNNFLQGSKIFKDREVLRPDYIPNTLPHREQQIIRIGSILAPVLQGSRGSNILLYGQTGTGKTAVVKYILRRLMQKTRDLKIELTFSYVNCRLSGTEYRILANLSADVGIHIPFTGLATNEVYERFTAELDNHGYLMIVILDEVDALVKSQGDALLYELTRINEYLKRGRLSIIGISNDLRFKELLDPRVLSSLSEEEVVFQPYTAPEIKDILLERSTTSFHDGVLLDGILNVCAALAAAEHGDARRALDLLRVAGEIAERDGSNSITEKHVRLARDKIKQDRITIVLKSLSPHSKLVLCSVYLITKGRSSSFNTGEVYEVYLDLCNKVSFEPLTQRRISGLVSELDILGILNTRLVSLGRYGRTKKIRLNISRSFFKDVYLNDPWLNRLLTYHASRAE